MNPSEAVVRILNTYILFIDKMEVEEEKEEEEAAEGFKEVWCIYIYTYNYVCTCTLYVLM